MPGLIAPSIPVLYEHYNTGDDGGDSFGKDAWIAAPFDNSVIHNIKSISLKVGLAYLLYGSPDINIGIRSSKTGADLCIGTIPNGDIPGPDGGTFTACDWRNALMSPDNIVLAVQTYYIVFRAPLATFNSIVEYKADGSSPPGYGVERSSDSGLTWTSYAPEVVFEEYGVTAGGGGSGGGGGSVCFRQQFHVP